MGQDSVHKLQGNPVIKNIKMTACVSRTALQETVRGVLQSEMSRKMLKSGKGTRANHKHSVLHAPVTAIQSVHTLQHCTVLALGYVDCVY